MRIELRHMRCFIAVAEELHFRRAAEKLNLAQPALSRTISQLEDDLGVRLLERSNRRVSLTDEGREFLSGCYSTLDSVNKAIERTRRAARGDIGKLRIGYTDFAINGVLPAILDEFRRQHPDIEIELIYSPSHEQISNLYDHQLDFAFLTGEISETDIACITVQQQRFVCVLYEGHPLADKQELRVQDLAGEPMVVGAWKNWIYYRRHLDALCLRAGFRPRIKQEAHNSESIFGVIAAKMGITIHLDSARNYFRRGLIIRPLADENSTVEIQAAWLDRQLTPVQQKMITLLRHSSIKARQSISTSAISASD